MRILYGIQGTGHGHISRAREIVPLLLEHAEVDVLLSGYNCSMSLEGVRVMRKRGISLTYSRNGSVAISETIRNLKPVTFLEDVVKLNTKPYDLVISDYEPVSAWAAHRAGVPSLALSHQASFMSDLCPRPIKRSLFAEQILKKFAPCKSSLGFHFRRYDSFIEPPIIRSEVLNLKPVSGNHITVYLPAYHHKNLIPHFKNVKPADWHVFSPYCSHAFDDANVIVNPVDNKQFLKSLETCRGVLTSGGFETCAEAMYLNKKLMVVPIQNQYEQLCNAAALQQMGITVIEKITGRFSGIIEEWLETAAIQKLNEICDATGLRNRILNYVERPVATNFDSLQPADTSLQ